MFTAKLEQSIRQVEQGKVTDWETAKRELDNRFKKYEYAPGDLLTFKDLKTDIEKKGEISS